MTLEDLERYAAAWNAHDIDTIMSYMTDDCVFETGGGARYEGFEVVKARFIEVWTEIPDVSFNNGQHFLQGNRGCSEWTLCGTRKDGSKINVDGCDLFVFAGDNNSKIQLKNSYLKSS